MTRAILFIVILCFVSKSFGKTFSECDLVRELRKQGFPEHQLRDWMCLIEAESNRRTHVVGGSNSDGSHDFGLFQINDRYWCNNGEHPGKECNIRCKDLLLDDITIASQCTKKIFGVHGFNAWVAWVNKCKGKNLRPLPC
ncbi:lysozyme-like [Helicoverpa zea]|uniref:lysozyme-like n=1 Tax=Helicoverpa zea TaxID=7113 RepID=UPI001F57F9ED|nr:lysozyme-like [Helicoverpa zea]XP_049693234.1 lysozyme [Helicoverpa armigera]